jgi:lysophospholipase L1-like esterase
MLDCLILGDSIAVGTAHQRPECVSYAHGGWNSYQWNKNFITKDLSANIVIISLGSNDHQYVHTFQELLKLRENVKAEHVYWIKPAGNLAASNVDIENIQAMIAIIAKNYGDVVLAIPQISKDGIHPTGQGYRELAERTRLK